MKKLDAARDWAAVRASKEAHWRSLDAATRLRLSDDLRRHALLLHPDWPTPEQRAADYEAHVQLPERMERASAALKR